MEKPLGKVTVAIFADGGVSVSIDPKVTSPAHLRIAADTLSRIAAEGEARERPVRCPVCARDVRGIHAQPNGDFELAPCGHSI